MIQKLPESTESVLGFKITGKVTLEEEKEWIARFEESIARHGRISALIVLGEEAGWGLKAGLEDIKWCMTHMKNLNKIAIVTDSKIWKWLISVDAQFAKLAHIGEKHFEPARIEEAWAWVKDESPRGEALSVLAFGDPLHGLIEFIEGETPDFRIHKMIAHMFSQCADGGIRHKSHMRYLPVVLPDELQMRGEGRE